MPFLGNALTKTRIVALVPVLIYFVAWILSLLCLFAGSPKGSMEEYAIFTLNTSKGQSPTAGKSGYVSLPGACHSEDHKQAKGRYKSPAQDAIPTTTLTHTRASRLIRWPVGTAGSRPVFGNVETVREATQRTRIA